MPLATADDIADQPEDAGFDGGKGTETDPYRISSYSQLLWFAKKVNSGTSYDGKHILLTTDIVINNTSDFSSWSTHIRPSTYFIPSSNDFHLRLWRHL